MQIEPMTNKLFVKEKEIGIVYFRTGYQYEQYTSEADWKVREDLECSMAIKCPSIDLHLLTFKKFQQAFAEDDLLYSVMGEENEKTPEILSPVFKGIWSLETLSATDLKHLRDAAPMTSQ